MPGMTTASRAPELPRRIHALGAGGAGVSAALQVLAARGHALSGSDAADSELAELVRRAGVPVAIETAGFAPLPGDVELLVRSAAVPDDHPQVAAAKLRGVPVWKYAELLGALTPRGRTLAVAGTHGKTTTAWMLHHALAGMAEAAGGPRPGALVGGICSLCGSNAVCADPGGWFAVEACEYDRTFLRLAPSGAIVTNVEADHLDCYGTLAAIEEAFAQFAARVEEGGALVVGRDVPAAVEAAAGVRVLRAGRDFATDLLGCERGRFRFRLRGPDFALDEVELGVPGEFNVANAAQALVLAAATAGREHVAAGARALARFRGAKRRFEPWGEVGGFQVVHDYAHHPTELACTLEAARRVFPGAALAVLFQPHQHSRTARFLGEFVESLARADLVVVADVYGARAHVDRVSAGAPELVRGLQERGVEAVQGGDLASSARIFARLAPPAGGLLVIGAGDVETIRGDLLHELALRCALPRGSQA